MITTQRKISFAATCRVLCVAAVALAIFACGDSLSGKYEATGEAAGAASVEFKGDKAYVTIVGMTTETEYEVNGDKVVFKRGKDAGENLVMTREKDGSL